MNDYKDISSIENYTGPKIGVKISIAGLKLTDEEHNFVIYGNFAETIRDGILEIRFKNDPKTKEERKETIKKLTLCFSEPIYVKETPNEYSNSYNYFHKPWLLVTTRKGPIKIGWRKSVINIDWTDSDVKLSAAQLFPDEKTTKGDKFIHAWSYEDAAKYIKKVLEN